jgi:hypothetical protein
VPFCGDRLSVDASGLDIRRGQMKVASDIWGNRAGFVVTHA